MGRRSTGSTAVVEGLSGLTGRDDRERRPVLLEQRIRYSYSRPVTNLHQRLKIVPPPEHGPQRRRRWQLEVHGVDSWSARTYVDAFGNPTVDVHAPAVEDAVEFALDVEADTSGSTFEAAVDGRYRQHTRLTEADDAIAGLATGLRQGDVATICRRVHESIGYEWGVTGVRTTAAEALAGSRGVCQDYAHIMVAACRFAGLGARYVSGHLAGEGGSHAWVEVLRPHPFLRSTWTAEGWDPTHNRRVNAGYLVVATGRDYSDVAPLAGTYDGLDASNTLVVDKRLHLACPEGTSPAKS
jgi:transglutaminase-like putative cysteine protease